MFSNAERVRRFTAADDMMIKEGLSGLLILGNGAVGTNSYGAFRYLVDNRTFYYLQAAVFAPRREPVSIASSIISQLEFVNKSFVKDCRVETDPIKGIIKVFRELGISSGRVGTIMELLPTSWLIPLQAAFPHIEWVDIAEKIYDFRILHSKEEISEIKACGEIADAGFRAVCETIKPGMTEQQAVAELEYATLKNGGEYNFTLISSGRFSFSCNKLPFLHAATMFDKVIEVGDSVAMEITPRHNGYWTQLVRTISIGEENPDLSEIHKVVLDLIQDVLPELRPGNPISAIPHRIRRFTEKAGYVFALPCGHICGCDLNEERLTESNNRLLVPGMAVILHPTVLAPGLDTSIFWGETYLITEKGCEKLTATGNELIVV